MMMKKNEPDSSTSSGRARALRVTLLRDEVVVKCITSSGRGGTRWDEVNFWRENEPQ